jgi:hypothetical protein
MKLRAGACIRKFGRRPIIGRTRSEAFQAAIIAIARAMRDLPAICHSRSMFPDYLAPVVRNVPDGVRELSMARWGMPGPPAFGGAP